MSAEKLREAARLMRERAEAAAVFSPDAGHDFAICEDQRDAEHIASWHPAVALTVADLLDMASVGACCDECMSDLAADPFRHQALAVATAYLNEASS